MGGTLSSLGLGSSGALSADTIDKLKANDEKFQIDPIKAKIENANQKTQAYDLLSSLMTTFGASADKLGGDLLYLDRTTTVTGDGADITAADGVFPQSFTIDVTTLATKDIQQSTQFTSETSQIANSDGTLTLSIDGKDFDIEVTSSMTLEDFKGEINKIAGDKVTASILNVADGDYRLVISSDETGDDQDITFSDASAFLKPTVNFADTEVQNGTDASFKYNGIDFTRSSNEITDITLGVTINLKKEGESSTATVSQSTDEIVSELSLFTSSYNSLVSQLTSTTTSDLEKGTVGVFNGESSVRDLTRSINKLLFQVDSNGNSLVNYGFELGQDGTLTFNESTFKTEFKKDPETVEKLFKYETNPKTGELTEGVFKKLDIFLDAQSETQGAFTLFGKSISNSVDGFIEEQSRTQKLLDTRYETMFFRFAAYDKIIGGLERQFGALQLQIEASINSK